MTFTLATGCGRGLCRKSCSRSDHQLNVYDWLADIPGNNESTDLVEVQFKNTRKGYYHNINGLDLKKGDWVAVEATPGHDIGVVTLTGRLAIMQVKKANLKSADDIKRVYRFARDVDMEKYEEAKDLLPEEHTEVIIAGGNHAQFGNYGEQDGDGIATISSDEQQDATVNAIIEFIGAKN